MPQYIAERFHDRGTDEALLDAGYPPDVPEDDPAQPSLWLEYYSNLSSFYADVTLLGYALLIDRRVRDDYVTATFTPNATDPRHQPGSSPGSSGLALPQRRAAYTPSSFARAKIAQFAHSGEIERPLISIACTRDTFITPDNNARTYATAVALAGRRAKHELYLVEGGTHLDALTAFEYGLQPQLRFARAAFDRLVRIVEHGARPSGATRVVQTPTEID